MKSLSRVRLLATSWTAAYQAPPSMGPTAEPTPEVWAQFQANMGSLDALETEDRSSLVAAINEACSSGGSVSEEQVEKILADYLQENNITGGRDGEDGVSATHAWNGTVLTVTSASGTSSADLKGEKGEKGDTGLISHTLQPVSPPH